MKELNNVNSNDIISPKLPQFKSYLKILDIPYFIDNINLSVISNIIQRVIKTTHIFDNTVLAFYFCIIKASLKSNMVIVWVDIWDFQNHTKAKLLINRYFNIEYYITTIRGTNMNPSILQCKNCQKWDYTMYTYCIHGLKCQKCNSLHKLEHHRKIVWCYKANFKTNTSRLKTKKGELCTHSFKCINQKDEHQIDSNNCPFWKHRFNWNWHNKKLQELQGIRANSICLSVDGVK